MSLPGFDTVDAAFSAAAARWPDRPMLNVLAETAARYDIPSGEIAYAEAGATVAALAARLTDAGYGAGHRLMLAFENRPAYFLWVLAANRIGAAVVPVNPDLRVAELAYIIGHAEPALAVGLPGPLRLIAEATREAGSAMPAVTPDDPLPPPANTGTAAPGQGLTREAALLYTSGTTGQPKGCILTNEYFLTAARWYRDAGGLCAIAEDPAERMITPLPVFHMNAFAVSFMAMLGVGGCLTVLDRFSPRRRGRRNVAGWACTCLHYLGVMPSILMKAPPGPDDRAHSVRFVLWARPETPTPLSRVAFGLPVRSRPRYRCIATIAANHHRQHRRK
ncbi:MAG: AMP-binding protein [Paracoccaceae bacterium]